MGMGLSYPDAANSVILMWPMPQRKNQNYYDTTDANGDRPMLSFMMQTMLMGKTSVIMMQPVLKKKDQRHYIMTWLMSKG